MRDACFTRQPGAHAASNGWHKCSWHRRCLVTAVTPATRSHHQRPRANVKLGASPRTVVRGAEDPPGLRPEPWSGTRDQEQALAALRARLAADDAPAPDDAVLRWYLRDRYFDVNEAEAKLRSMLRWRREFRPDRVTRDAVAPELATGKAYVHTQPDVYGRPVIVIRCQRHRVGEFRIEDSKRLCVYLIDQAVQQALAAGGEQIIGVFDLRGFQVPQNADFVFARFMVEAFFEYYPRRVGQVLFVDAPWVFQPAWQVIRPLMRKYAALVRFVSTEELRAEFFTAATVPDDFRS